MMPEKGCVRVVWIQSLANRSLAHRVEGLEQGRMSVQGQEPPIPAPGTVCFPCRDLSCFICSFRLLPEGQGQRMQ